LPATCLNDIDVIILAGGLGTRLRSLFPDRPKVLVPVNGVPFLRCYLDWLAKFGARRVVLSLGYKAEMVRAYLESEKPPGLEIYSFAEPAPLGTGGGLRAVLPLVRSESALVLNGDSLTRVDLCKFVSFHQSKNARASIVLTFQPNVTQLGLVETANDDSVVSFSEKPQRESGGYINAGIYLMQHAAIAGIPEDRPVSIEREVFPGLCGRGLYAMKGQFPFIDIGTPESYRRAAEFFRQEAQ